MSAPATLIDQRRRIAGRFEIAILVLMFLAVLGPRALAVDDDRVTVRKDSDSAPFVVTGTVEAYNGRRLEMRAKGTGSLQTYNTQQVLAVESHRRPEHLRGIAAFEAANLDEAERELSAAADLEPRLWMQQEIFATLIRTARRRGDRIAASRYFERLLAGDPETRFWSLAPLVWSSETISSELADAAQRWRDSRSEGVRLMGASVLFLDAAEGPAARREMEKLARSSNQSVQVLARAQSWRLRLAEGDVLGTELANWRERIARTPPALRAGPTYLLGRAAAQRNELEQAAGEWLWLPLVYADDDPLAAQALFDAANALASLGRAEEAAAAYQEVTNRFPWSPIAAEARQKLNPPAPPTP